MNCKNNYLNEAKCQPQNPKHFFFFFKLCLKCVDLRTGMFFFLNISFFEVAWVRGRDGHILTVGKETFVADPRISSVYSASGILDPSILHQVFLISLFCIRYSSSVSLKSSHGMHWLQEILRRGL